MISVPFPPAPIRCAPAPVANRADDPLSVVVIFEPADSPRRKAPVPPMLNEDVLLRVMLPLGKFVPVPPLKPALTLAATRDALLLRTTSLETLPIPLPRPIDRKPVTLSVPPSI